MVVEVMVVAMIHRTDGRTDVAMAVGPMVALAMPVLSYREDEVSQQKKYWQLVGFFFWLPSVLSFFELQATRY